MENIGSLLSNRNIDEPPEIRDIKAYVQKNYNAEVQITMQPHSIIVQGSAGLVGTLRANLPKLEKAANTDKKIILRVG